MKPGRLIAEVRYGATAHVRATPIKSVRGREWYFRVRLGAKRMMTCDCGGAVQHRPDALTYDESWGGCSHIVALYKGNVTQDARAATPGDYHVSYLRGTAAVHFVRLTQLGKKIFYPRWVALKLS
jgi:hypothetical protein